MLCLSPRGRGSGRVVLEGTSATLWQCTRCVLHTLPQNPTVPPRAHGVTGRLLSVLGQTPPTPPHPRLAHGAIQPHSPHHRVHLVPWCFCSQGAFARSAFPVLILKILPLQQLPAQMWYQPIRVNSDALRRPQQAPATASPTCLCHLPYHTVIHTPAPTALQSGEQPVGTAWVLPISVSTEPVHSVGAHKILGHWTGCVPWKIPTHPP